MPVLLERSLGLGMGIGVKIIIIIIISAALSFITISSCSKPHVLLLGFIIYYYPHHACGTYLVEYKYTQHTSAISLSCYYDM